jgi:hypothetical protein
VCVCVCVCVFSRDKILRTGDVNDGKKTTPRRIATAQLCLLSIRRVESTHVACICRADWVILFFVGMGLVKVWSVRFEPRTVIGE